MVGMDWNVSVSVTVPTRPAVLSTVEDVRLAVLQGTLGKIAQVGQNLNLLYRFQQYNKTTK